MINGWFGWENYTRLRFRKVSLENLLASKVG